MPTLEVELWTPDRDAVVTYRVDGELKRPGEAVQEARERALEDGYDSVNLKQVALASE